MKPWIFLVVLLAGCAGIGGRSLPPNQSGGPGGDISLPLIEDVQPAFSSSTGLMESENFIAYGEMLAWPNEAAASENHQWSGPRTIVLGQEMMKQ